jgi:hypothetical protein
LGEDEHYGLYIKNIERLTAPSEIANITVGAIGISTSKEENRYM